MKIQYPMAAVLAASSIVSACATAPENIAPSYVPTVAYDGMDCATLKNELVGVSSEVARVTGQQRKKATNDKWATGVGIVLFWPALFFLATGDKADQLAKLKGQYNALVGASKAKKCDFAGDLKVASD